MRVLVAVLLVVASAGATPAVAAGNEVPMAEAGLDQSVHQGTTVVLDAGGSYDPDGDVQGYEWSIRTPEGRVIGPEDHEAPRTTFLARHTGRYVVTLTVTDDDGATATDTAYVEVTPGAPGGGSGDAGTGADVADGDGGNGTDGGTVGGDETDRRNGRDASGGVSGTGTDGPGAGSDPGPDGSGEHGGTTDPGSESGSGETDGAGDSSDRGSTDGAGDSTDGDGSSDADSGSGGTESPGPGTGAGANSPPWATIDGPATLRPGEHATYDLSAGDVESRIGAVEWAGGGSGPQVTRTAPASGNLTLSVSVGDDDGELTVVTRTVRVASGENHPPDVELLPPGSVRIGETVRFEATVEDPDGEVVSVSVSPNRTIRFGAVRPHTVRVRATDDDGAVATDTLRVTPHRANGGGDAPTAARWQAVEGVRNGLRDVTPADRRR
jgi:hypothetical protein